jgi:hypothetical protein
VAMHELVVSNWQIIPIESNPSGPAAVAGARP